MGAVLTYHSIDPSGSAISVSAEDFRQQMKWLADGGAQVIPLGSILNTHSRTAVALTFDDGFTNFESVAMPVLAEYGFGATLFVVSQRVGGTNEWAGAPARHDIPILPLLDWNGIVRAAERGVEIGSHTRTHPRLSHLHVDQIRREMAGSGDDIERVLGVRPVSFCYPYGDAGDVVVAEAKQLFGIGVTTELREVSPGSDMPLRIPRIDMYYFRGGTQLERLGSDSFARRLRLRRAARNVRALFS